MYLLIAIVLLTIVEANQRFTCKPQPGCHFARCSPLWPVTVPALREMNEFPINCVKNGTDPKDEDQDMVLESHKQKISELTDDLTQANEKIKELKNNSDWTLKEMASQTQKLSELMAELADASRRIKELGENSALKSIEQKFSLMTNDQAAANGRIEELEKQSGLCAFTYRGKCFWFDMHDAVKCERASEICAARGGKPANIYSKFHYYMLLGYLRIFTRAYGYTNAWLGVKYNPNTNVVSLSDGSTATFVKWFSGYPSRHQDSCVMLSVHPDPGSENQNLANTGRAWTTHGVICEI